MQGVSGLAAQSGNLGDGSEGVTAHTLGTPAQGLRSANPRTEPISPKQQASPLAFMWAKGQAGRPEKQENYTPGHRRPGREADPCPRQSNRAAGPQTGTGATLPAWPPSRRPSPQHPGLTCFVPVGISHDPDGCRFQRGQEFQHILL